jgi:hypothetical protein
MVTWLTRRLLRRVWAFFFTSVSPWLDLCIIAPSILMNVFLKTRQKRPAILRFAKIPAPMQLAYQDKRPVPIKEF